MINDRNRNPAGTREPDAAAAPAPGLGSLLGAYDAVLIDAWGVLHDGVAPYPGTLECLRRLRRQGKPVIVVTNAARREAPVLGELCGVGFDAKLFHAVVSSGELAWQALRTRADPWHARLGRRCYLLSTERSRALADGLGLALVDDLAAAGFVLNTGPPFDSPDTAPFETLLAAAAAAGLPMICANPDLEAIRAGVRGISAGALAASYERHHRGDVYYHGKPHAPIFERALAALAPMPRRRVLMIGDSLTTDIPGANRAGLDCVFISGGIHGEELKTADTGALFHRYGCRATFVLDGLYW